MIGRRWWPLGVALCLLAPAACSDDGPGPGEARLLVDGRVEVERADGEVDVVDDAADVRRGDRVTVREGSALMRLRGGTELELREGLASAASTTVLMGDRPVLEAGDLLVSTPESVGLDVDGTEVEVTDGAARLTRAFGMSVAAYDADVALDSAGVLAEVPALRQMVVPDLGRPPQKPRPVAPDAEDSWDLRYLGAAMDLGDRLEDIADGLTGFLPEGEGRTPGFFRLVLPGLEDEADFGADLLEPRLDAEPGETLIGAAITERGERGRFEERWDAVFAFRDEGADWGIVALDQAVRSAPLIGSVEEALNASVEQAAVTQPAPDPGLPGTPDPSGGTDGGIDGGSGSGDGPPAPPTTAPPGTQPPPTPPPTTPPAPPVTVPETPEVLDPVVDPVADLLDDLVGGLLGGLTG